MNEYFIKLKNFTLDFWQDSDVRIYLFGSWARGEAYNGYQNLDHILKI